MQQDELQKKQAEIWRKLRTPYTPILNRADSILSGLAELRMMPPATALHGSAPFVTHKLKEVRREAATTFQLALSQIDEADFESILDWDSWDWPRGCASPDRMGLIWLHRHRVDEDRDLFRMAVFAASGYVREHALQKLAVHPDALDWPFALMALNDWVPQVRNAADQLSRALISGGHLAALRRWPGFLSSLAAKSRMVPEEALAPIILALAASGDLEAIWAQFHRTLRQLAVSLLLEAGSMPGPLIEEVLKGRDAASIRQVVAGQVLHASQSESLLLHPMPAARSLALSSLAGEEVLKQGLLDPSRQVRSTAQFLLQKRGFDVRGFYLQAMQADANIAAVEGFCDVAMKDDLPMLRELYKSPFRRQRIAVARALMDHEDETLVYQMLADTSGKVRRLALPFALTHPATVDENQRKALFNMDRFGIHRVGATLLMRQSRWESLPWILQQLSSPSPPIASEAQRRLESWLKQSRTYPIKPSAIDLIRANQAAAEVRHLLSDGQVKELQGFLTWTPHFQIG